MKADVSEILLMKLVLNIQRRKALLAGGVLAKYGLIIQMVCGGVHFEGKI